MDNTWILVANASAAVLYNFKKLSLDVVEQFQHPDSRKKDGDLVSDNLDQYRSHETGHGNFVPRTDPHEYQAALFAKQLVDRLDQGRRNNQYKSLILVAPPHFLGLLRQDIDKHPMKDLVIKEFHKDYVHEKPEQLILLLELK